MKPTLHILAKDLRRFWPLIAVAVAVNILGYCVAFSNLDATRLLMGGNLVKVLHQAPLVRWAVVFLLSVWVILEDRGVGDRIAWMTRPIFARELTVAKFLFLVLGVALPAGFVAAGIALWLKASLGTALLAGLSDGLFTLFAATIFAGLAVICASMNQAVLLTAGAFGGVALLAFVLFEVVHLTLPASSRDLTPGTPFLVITGMTAISTAAVLAHQYATLRARRTLLLGAVLALGTWTIGRWWPVSVWPRLTAFASAAPSSVANLKFVAGNTAADFRALERAFGESKAGILVPLRLEGMLPDRHFEVRKATSTLVMDDGTKISTAEWSSNPQLEDDLAGAAALGFSTPAFSPTRYVSVVTCPLEQFKKIQGRTGRLEASFEVLERRYEMVARLPVRAGAEVRIDGRRSRIISTQYVNGSLDIGFQFAEINPILGPRSSAWPNHYLLVNDKRGEYSESYGGNVAGTGGVGMTLLTSHNRFGETRHQKTSAIAGKIDAAWLADADFCFVVGRELNAPTLLLPLKLDQLTVPTKQVTRHVIVIDPDGTRSEYER